MPGSDRSRPVREGCGCGMQRGCRGIRHGGPDPRTAGILSGRTGLPSGDAVIPESPPPAAGPPCCAPLMHDFAVISLSDLLTPWEQIAQRLALAAQGDFVICLYNPASKKRADYLQKACDIVLQYQPGKPFADWSGTSAGKGNPHGSSPFPPCGIPRQICLPPSISAIGRPGRSTSGW